MNITETSRRPIKARTAEWSHVLAHKLTGLGLTPNQVSCLSIAAAATAGALLLCAMRASAPINIFLLLLAALFVQLRLICNLLDGLMAVEGGQKSVVGELFNEFPDRISDTIILVCAGHAISHFAFGVELGWLCALLALLTAYIRAFGAHCTKQQDFCGPMAKQHRMFCITVALIASAAAKWFAIPVDFLLATLLIIAVGSVVTCIRRVTRLAQALRRQACI